MTREKIVKGLTYCYMIPFCVIVVVNVFFSILRSTYFELYMKNEIPSYRHDNAIKMLLALGVAVVILTLLYVKLLIKNQKTGLLILIACSWATVMCLFFVGIFRCGAVCDAQHVSDMTVQFMQDNYEAFERGTYLYSFPFQVGMIAFFEIIYRLFGVENYLAFQIVNTICIVMVIFLLHRISDELFEDKRIVMATSIMSMMLIPFFMFSNLVYGDIPGFSLGALAIYFGIRYLKTSQWKYIVVAGFCYMIGLIIKGNNLIFVVAITIILLLKTFQDKNWKRFLSIIFILILSQIGTFAVDQMYVKRAGLEEMPKGTPKLSWVAMGLQETDETGNGCGWYNGYNLRVHYSNGYDYDIAKKESIESIKESVVHFVTHPGRAVYYFYRKFVSQWNDPSFQSQIMVEWYGRYTDDPCKLTNYLVYEEGRTKLFQIQNVLHMVVFFFVAIGSVVLLKKWSFERAYYVLNIFGGIFFHMLIWESKGRYVLVYYVLMIPIAALGYQTFGEKVIAWIQKAKEYRNDKREQKAI